MRRAVSSNRYIRDMVYLQQPAPFISVLHSASPQIEGRLKRPSRTRGFHFVPIQLNPAAARMHVCMQLYSHTAAPNQYKCSHPLTTGAAMQPAKIGNDKGGRIVEAAASPVEVYRDSAHERQ